MLQCVSILLNRVFCNWLCVVLCDCYCNLIFDLCVFSCVKLVWFKVSLSVSVIRTCKNASLLSCSSSLVNLMFVVVLSILCTMSSVLSFLTVVSTSSTYLSHVLMLSLFVTALLSRSCITASARKLESGNPIGVSEICR